MNNIGYKQHRKRAFRGICLGVLVLLLIGCGGSSSGGATQVATVDLQKQLTNLETRISNIIGEARCDEDSQCSTLPMGNVVCGGPKYHIPYSSVNTDVAMLKELTAEHRALSWKDNVENTVVSTCPIIEPAPVACVNHQCIFTEEPLLP